VKNVLIGEVGHGLDGMHYMHDGSIDLEQIAAVEWFEKERCWVWLHGNSTRFCFRPSEKSRPGAGPSWTSSLAALTAAFPRPPEVR